MVSENTVFVESLGCAKNLVDSEVMLGCLARAGYLLADEPQDAAIIIINTCAFIESATREALDTILEYAQLKQNGSCRCLVVCGCLTQRYKEELPPELPEVDLFLGSGEYARIDRHLRAFFEKSDTRRLKVSRTAFLLSAATPRMLSAPGSSAYVKIAEGCSHHCTYCTIPSIKGPFRQRGQSSIVREVRSLAAQGIEEINLVAQDTTRYEGLVPLLKKLVRVQGLRWIRLLYAHPQHLTTDLLRLMADEEKLCRYLDLPLQHVCDAVLRRMGRKTTRKKIDRLLETARKLCPDIALRTTVIVGFPGETDADFSELLDFVRRVRFSHLGAFTYSDEAGTPAAGFPDKIPEKTKRLRYNELMRLQSGISRENNRLLRGREMTVLVEGISQNRHYCLQARTAFQAPEIDGVVYLNEPVTIGSFQRVKIVKTLTYDLAGRVL